MTVYAPAMPWLQPPAEALDRLDRLLERADGRTRVFFRADDVGLPSAGFASLVETFIRHRTPLALAVVPAWLPMRQAELERQLASGGSLWFLHQHGFRHVSHEPAESSPKKSEFGPSRPAEAKRRNIARGRDILEQRLGHRFRPMFTPPWNRCDAETLEALASLGFRAVSRSQGARPSAPPGLAELPVSVDLHTRKEPTAEAALDALLAELEQGLTSGPCGIMIHHQRMNRAALEFLDHLLAGLKQHGLRVAHPAELLP